MLNTSGRNVLIIGGGEIAARKAEKIMAQGASVRIISSEFSEATSGLDVAKLKISIRDPSEIKDHFACSAFTIIATDDSDLNERLEDYCINHGILYNRVDEKRSPVIFPAVFESNGVTVAVSTSGKSPSLSRFIRDMLYEDLEKYSIALPVAEKLRNEIRISDFHTKAAFFRALLENERFWQLLRAGNTEDAFEWGLKLSDLFEDPEKNGARVLQNQNR